jgi:hypothetical protein
MYPFDRHRLSPGTGLRLLLSPGAGTGAGTGAGAGRGEPWTRVTGAVAGLEATDLRPGPVVDALFGSLVRAALALPADHPGIERAGARVRDLCARGEARLESRWAHRVIADPASLRAFPYLANYVALVRGEWEALTAALGRRPRRVAFVGSGPLPLSALLLHRLAPDVAVTCVDRDPDAVTLGCRVASSLGCDSSPAFVETEADDLDAGAFDVVVVAALVGITPAEKRAAVTALASGLGRDALLAVRSVPADGRQLLYPRLAATDVPAGLLFVGEWIPPPPVINSLVLLSRDGIE